MLTWNSQQFQQHFDNDYNHAHTVSTFLWVRDGKQEQIDKFFRKIDKQVDNDTHANKRWAELTINDADDARIQ